MELMKPRHAAALVLVSWYLMVPPQLPVLANKPNYYAPLSHWRIVYSFNSVIDCKNALDTIHRSEESARCVVTDNPRLKAK